MRVLVVMGGQGFAVRSEVELDDGDGPQLAHALMCAGDQALWNWRETLRTVNDTEDDAEDMDADL